MTTRKLIAYYRVSTKRQGESGLGLDGQVTAVEAYALAYGAEVLKTYREVETGKRADRPELLKAIAHAKRSKATLVIAKLDRLARNVAFTSNLMESGVEFVACDNPHANRLTVHILAAVAEDEAKRISDRTKAALVAFRDHKRVPRHIRTLYPQGVPAEIEATFAGKLGASRPGSRQISGEHARKGRDRAAEIKRADTRDAYADLAPLVQELRSEGLSLRQIASRLDAVGHTTRTGKTWNQVQVSRLLSHVS